MLELRMNILCNCFVIPSYFFPKIWPKTSYILNKQKGRVSNTIWTRENYIIKNYSTILSSYGDVFCMKWNVGYLYNTHSSELEKWISFHYCVYMSGFMEKNAGARKSFHVFTPKIEYTTRFYVGKKFRSLNSCHDI